jgi:hypothetical protein
MVRDADKRRGSTLKLLFFGGVKRPEREAHHHMPHLYFRSLECVEFLRTRPIYTVHHRGVVLKLTDKFTSSVILQCYIIIEVSCLRITHVS